MTLKEIASALGLHLHTARTGRHYIIVNDFVDMESYAVYQDGRDNPKFSVYEWGDPRRQNILVNRIDSAEELIHHIKKILHRNKEEQCKE